MKILMKSLISFLLLPLFFNFSFAESLYDLEKRLKDYEPARVKLNFPTFFIGLDYQVLNQSEVLLFETDTGTNQAELSNLLNPAMTLGLMSFSDHFTSTLTFRTAPFQSIDLEGSEDQFKLYVNQTLELSLKYYLWSLGYNQIRPYIGVGLSVTEYQHRANQDNSALVTTVDMPYMAGFSYSTKWGHFDFGGGTISGTTISYPLLDHSGFLLTGRPDTRFWFSYSHYLAHNKKVHKDDLFSMKNSDYFLGLGYQSSFLLDSDDSFHRNLHTFNPIVNLGYYFSKSQTAVLFSYRPLNFNYKNQGKESIYDNNIISLDLFKYLNDFNGVTQFVGVGINSSNLKRIIKEGAVDTELKQSVTNVSFIYGWETHVYSNPRLSFRTTLRYNPFDVLEFEDQNLSFNKFEFTFFELVFYPQRIFIP